MVKEELNHIGEYAKKHSLSVDEVNHFKFLLIKWMYEQGMLE